MRPVPMTATATRHRAVIGEETMVLGREGNSMSAAMAAQSNTMERPAVIIARGRLAAVMMASLAPPVRLSWVRALIIATAASAPFQTADMLAAAAGAAAE